MIGKYQKISICEKTNMKIWRMYLVFYWVVILVLLSSDPPSPPSSPPYILFKKSYASPPCISRSDVFIVLI